jgi:hypothetical protein
MIQENCYLNKSKDFIYFSYRLNYNSNGSLSPNSVLTYGKGTAGPSWVEDCYLGLTIQFLKNLNEYHYSGFLSNIVYAAFKYSGVRRSVKLFWVIWYYIAQSVNLLRSMSAQL